MEPYNEIIRTEASRVVPNTLFKSVVPQALLLVPNESWIPVEKICRTMHANPGFVWIFVDLPPNCAPPRAGPVELNIDRHSRQTARIVLRAPRKPVPEEPTTPESYDEVETDKARFSPGDRVVCNSPSRKGQTGYVVKPNGTRTRVKFDGGLLLWQDTSLLRQLVRAPRTVSRIPQSTASVQQSLPRANLSAQFATALSGTAQAAHPTAEYAGDADAARGTGDTSSGGTGAGYLPLASSNAHSGAHASPPQVPPTASVAPSASAAPEPAAGASAVQAAQALGTGASLLSGEPATLEEASRIIQQLRLEVVRLMMSKQ